MSKQVAKGAGATANGGRPHTKGKRRAKEEKVDDSADTASEADSVTPFQYKRPKPSAITAAGFMWAEVASFLPPRQVLEVEAVCRDVREQIRLAQRGIGVMNRYWNARWVWLVWDHATELPVEKRFLHVNSITRSAGKKNWRKRYVEEYPFWVQRTFQGKGINNNATNDLRVRFHREELNVKLSGAELTAKELTPEEALAKARRKRGVEVHVDTEPHSGAGSGAMAAASTGANGTGPKRGHDKENGGKKPQVLRPMKDASLGLSRDDYKMDQRQSHRKGKHQKGGTNKWSAFAQMEEDW